ncbi:MAG TPA: TonB-dependent receptor, partial [Bdellovibrionales bacterium]|nr:TonB-dependent receptor [Bdellovibrionales bacterium]
TSWSKSVFAKDEINLDPVRVTLAARYERVSTESRTFIVNDADVVSKVENEDDFFVPGVGAVWALSPTFSLLTGVNKGYAPSGPGQSDNVKPEESTNGELGFRYMKQFFAEAIGFYSDYKNIKGLCSFSAGCTGGTEETEFNGGEATVYGVESRVRFDGHWSGYKFPFELGYTFTSATFDTEFQTASPEWGVGVI